MVSCVMPACYSDKEEIQMQAFIGLGEAAERKAQEQQEAQERLARQLAWEAEQKKQNDIAAKAWAVARKAERTAIIGTISNDWAGLSIQRRTELNTAILGNPTRNYVFAGDGRLGKTTMLTALARLAINDGRRALVTSGMDWEQDVRANSYADFSDKRALDISAEGLKGCRPCFIGFDEVDKIGNTGWLLNHFHALNQNLNLPVNPTFSFSSSARL